MHANEKDLMRKRERAKRREQHSKQCKVAVGSRRSNQITTMIRAPHTETDGHGPEDFEYEYRKV